MADFNAAHQQVMGNEGKYSNNPADAGGETYKGIARKFWPQWGGWMYVDGVKARTTAQPDFDSSSYVNWVKYLNSLLSSLNQLQQLVLDFYKMNFWDKYRLSEVNNQTVAAWIYDHVVNGGGRGAMWIQEAAGVKADGAIGPQTIQAINSADPEDLLQEACDVAAYYRLDRAEADPSQIRFLPSWLRRDGVSAEEIRQVMQAAREGLTYDKVAELKRRLRDEG